MYAVPVKKSLMLNKAAFI